ncbi:MAG: hypothetical protein GTO18_22085 [Anaerolineales bacterium]|nr:hypothetical protein [Anaerolineales bacterium]
MKSIEEMTQGELAAFVQSHLVKKGIMVVLSGGSSVSFYSSNEYVSMDLDLVNAGFAKRRAIREVMQTIGFHEEGRHFLHPDTQFFVEFPPGPLSVGKEPVKQIDEHKLETGILRIISPTDCVKDRLANYYHFNDRQCLYQAALVVQRNPVKLEEVERWSEAEGMLDEYLRIKDQLLGQEP